MGEQQAVLSKYGNLKSRTECLSQFRWNDNKNLGEEVSSYMSCQWKSAMAVIQNYIEALWHFTRFSLFTDSYQCSEMRRDICYTWSTWPRKTRQVIWQLLGKKLHFFFYYHGLEKEDRLICEPYALSTRSDILLVRVGIRNVRCWIGKGSLAHKGSCCQTWKPENPCLFYKVYMIGENDLIPAFLLWQ